MLDVPEQRHASTDPCGEVTHKQSSQVCGPGAKLNFQLSTVALVFRSATPWIGEFKLNNFKNECKIPRGRRLQPYEYEVSRPSGLEHSIMGLNDIFKVVQHTFPN